jgi:hypothetical protein
VTPGIAQPDPLALAAPVWLFWFLSILTFTLHVLPMNLVLGGSILGAISRWRARSGDARHEQLARLIGKLLPVVIATAVSLGVAALLFLQVLYGRLFFSSSVLMAWSWLGVVPILIVAYYLAYAVAFRGDGRRSLAVAWTVAALVTAIGFIYSNNMTLLLRPADMPGMFAASAAGTHLNLADSMLPPRFLHMLVGALALAGAGIAILGYARRHRDPAFAQWAIKYGSWWFVSATVVNVMVGTWFLAMVPEPALRGLLGRDRFAAAILAAGIVAAVAAVALMVSASQAKQPGRALLGGTIALVLTTVLMVLTRDFVRRATLGAAGWQWPADVQPQWGPIAIFAVLLVAAIALVAWMIAVLVRAVAPAPEAEPVVQG